MTTEYTREQMDRDLELSSQADPVFFHFRPSRRDFVQVLGAGLIIAVCAPALGQQQGNGRGAASGGGRGGRGGGGTANLFARLHLGKDGIITVLCGKVECGQGARAEITQAAAEELRVPISQVSVILADTELVPDDGATVGSQTTPRTIPAIRQAGAAARELLIALACKQLNLQPADVTVSEGRVFQTNSNRSHTLSYADLATAEDVDKLFAATAIDRQVGVSREGDWKVLGTPVLRPNARDIVMGRHEYPSDVQRPGMLYGKVLRAPAYFPKRTQLDTAEARAVGDVVIVEDGDFAGVAAATSDLAEKAVTALLRNARWSSEPHPASRDLADYLAKNAVNVPVNRYAGAATPPGKALAARYFVPYVQHAPMEPRAAVAEWANGKLTVWTGSQNPTAVRSQLARELGVALEYVRVIINDFGGGFGGKHTGECAVEAARLAKGAGKPASLRYTREEEFTWAYFRPAGVIECQAALDAAGKITSWYFVNIHSGPSAVATPYAIAENLCQTVNIPPAAQPLRVGSYRGLAATANAWARESFMDELAQAAGQDALAFRRAHLQDARLRDVLEAVAKRFDWAGRTKRNLPNTGLGIACAVEKGSYVATAAQVTLDRQNNSFNIDQITEAFECGKILNPAYLLSQVQGAVIQGLGPALREAMVFEDGRMQNASFVDYRVPRFKDVPPLDIELLDRPDLPSAGAGETPLITLAPALTNALSRALGQRLRELPLTMPSA